MKLARQKPRYGYRRLHAPLERRGHVVNVKRVYTITVMPEKRIETSWRLFYQWNAPSNSSPIGDHASSEQEGQAVHLNGTLAFEELKGPYAGPNGYYLRQVSASRIDTRAFPGRQQIGGIGPGTVMQRKKWFYFANLYHEAGVRDMSEGNKIVLRAMRVFRELIIHHSGPTHFRSRRDRDSLRPVDNFVLNNVWFLFVAPSGAWHVFGVWLDR